MKPGSCLPQTCTEPKIQLSFLGSQDWRTSFAVHPIPVFLASQRLSGTVDIEYQRSVPRQQDDYVQVTLIGSFTAKSWTPNHPCGELWNSKIRNEQFLRVTKHFCIGQAPTAQEGSLTIPSTWRSGFLLQPCHSSATKLAFGPPTTGHELQDSVLDTLIYTRTNTIPSTGRVKMRCPRRPGGTHGHESLELTVRYNIHVALVRPQGSGGNEMLTRTCSEICILDDSMGIQPPTCITDFEHEYKLHHNAILQSRNLSSLTRKLISRRQTETFSISVQTIEPRPLVLRRDEEYATTIVSLKLDILASAHRAVDKFRDSVRGSVEASWRLQKSTFCSFDMLKNVPTLQHTYSTSKPTAVVRKVTIGKIHGQKQYFGMHNAQGESFDHSSIEARDDTYHNYPTSSRSAKGYGEVMPGPAGEASCISRCLVDPSSRTAVTSSELSEVGMTRECASHKLSTTVHLPIHVSRRSLPPPTSFTPYMATRYSLEIHLAVTLSRPSDEMKSNDKSVPTCDPVSGMRRRLSSLASTHSFVGNANLSVPIQLVYETASSELRSEQLPDRGSGTGVSMAAVEEVVNNRSTHDVDGSCGDVVEEALPKYSSVY